MSSNGPPRNYYRALEVNLMTCAKGTNGGSMTSCDAIPNTMRLSRGFASHCAKSE